MKCAFFLFAATVCAQPVVPVDPALAEIAATHRFLQTVISPDGAHVAYVEALAGPGESAIYLAPRTRISAGDGKAACDEGSLDWSPDSQQLAFLSDREKKEQLQLYVVPASGGPARQLTHLKGLLANPKWSPDGKRIAILFTENLPHAAGPLDPVPPDSGVLGSQVYEQRLAIVDVATGTARQISPRDMYIYEYDWSPDGRAFAVTSSPGAGDDNWWIAQLYTMPAEGGALKVMYKPSVDRQIAAPRWSPDGKSIVFIGGLMSDQGSTGGDVFAIEAAGGTAHDLTPGMASSASNINWPRNSGQLYFTEHYDGGSAVSELDPATGKRERLWQGDEIINAPFDDRGISMTADGKSSVVIRNSWQKPPEIWSGPIGDWQEVTHENAERKPLWGEAKSLHWTNDGFRVQGWLLYPNNYDASKKYPMVVAVHGGPASSLKPAWPRPGFNPTLLSQQGYFVLMPNPRGSYGQGEKFAMANVRDFGGGDLRDILAGVDQAIRAAPIDPQRVGITGWSYGGFMTMFAVTQTTRFHAAVAGAGISNWQSYYGENSIDTWMIPYFGATVYDDPSVYAKMSAIDFIKNVKTPTLVVVGERDGECPAPQSYEFYHALKTLGVKTEMVVYPNEGHSFHSPAHQKDVLLRMIAWFNQNLK
ncbi:MAG TPA: S9 family peptidase [Bryobacteraceae bacterium]|jgi:dipeptidyl aminopeptidase/acylaminoacyl peptidase|nr:S9 family peptidase [Bryobacteraceae bacterium]